MRSKTEERGSWGLVVLGVGLIVMASQSASAQPVYVVDTGPGGTSGGLSLTVDQHVAGQFTLDAGHEIYALEGWMIYPTILGSLPVDAVLYGDDDGVPDLDDEVYSQLFQVPAVLSPGWHGIEGLSLPVYGGTYWLAFEVPTDLSGSGAMPPTPLQELDLYAVDGGGGYLANTTARLGIRVLPEPGMASLLVCGGLGVAAIGRRRMGSG